MQLVASISDEAVRELLRSLSGRDVNAAANRAINRAATTLKSDASREVRQSYALKARYVGGRTIDVQRSSPSTLTALIRVKGGQIPISQFGSPRQTKKGVTVTVRKGKGRDFYPRAFFAILRGGQREVYWRAKGSAGKLVPRGPLRILLGPSVAQIASAKPFTAKLLRTARERIVTTLRQEIRFRLNRTHAPKRFTQGA
jgi:hypothetical protein